ncbi:nucleotide sugar dehydrogenase [Candidatus Micrarchaeota archaeon]|nr:nucleotide sugar dehydrogenase [Candidatus Micrarchaeota archaeon]
MVYTESMAVAEKRMREHSVGVSVVGIGTIGLPTAIHIAHAGFPTIGIDVNRERVKKLNGNVLESEYPQMLRPLVSSGTIKATTDFSEAIPHSKIIVVCVPTPVGDDREINLSFLQRAARELAPHLTKGSLVVLESSITIGTTRSFGKLIEEKSGLRIGSDWGLAYCPERYNPGLPTETHAHVIYDKKTSALMMTLDQIPRVVGGVDEKSLKLARLFYSEFILAGVTPVADIETAEASKLMENIFRDVNIALVNEFAVIFSKLGLDTYDVIQAAETKPFAFLPHFPGLVGGECIPVDTWYLIKQAEKMGVDTKMMRVTREVNDGVADYFVSLLQKAFEERNVPINESKVCIMGIAYKKNIPDARVSLSNTIAQKVRNLGVQVVLCDPVIRQATGQTTDIRVDGCLDTEIRQSDAVILATDHDIFRSISLADLKRVMRTPILLDARNFYDQREAIAAGFYYRGLGKPENPRSL